MLIEQVRELSPLDRLVYWIKERHQVFLKKRRGMEKPWTDDTILQSYFFTNPYRENDKVTVWFRDRIRGPLADDPRVLFATLAFRWFNYIPTGAILLGSGIGKATDLFSNWNTEEALRRLKLVDGQVFTGAFNISNGGSTKPKIDRVCEDYIQPVVQDCAHIAARWDPKEGSLQAMFDNLSMFPGLGGSGFMAAQVVCDLKYTYLLKDAPDWHTWSSIGPGSRRGMNILHGYPDNKEYSKAEWHKHMVELREIVSKRLAKMPPLHAQDLQNCLCEYSKYSNALSGIGRMKRRYPGNG